MEHNDTFGAKLTTYFVNTHNPVNGAKPLVSIGVPTWNRYELLQLCLNSVLSQTYTNFECIIMDNCSIDQTHQVCQQYLERDNRFRYYRQSTFVTSFANFNDCFLKSRGKYFCWLGDDDVWEPDFLLRCVEALEKDDSVILAAPWFHYHYEDCSKIVLNDWPNVIRLSIYDRTRYIVQNLEVGAPIMGLIRSAALRRTKLFQELYGPEQLLLIELSLYGSFKIVPKVLYHKFYEQANLGYQSTPSRKTGYYWKPSRFGLMGDAFTNMILYLTTLARHMDVPIIDRLKIGLIIIRHHIIKMNRLLFSILKGKLPMV